MNLIAPDKGRGQYAVIENFLKTRMGYQNPIISETDLRLEASLEASKQAYTFQIEKGNNNTDGALENKLGDNELIFVTAVGLGLIKTDTSTDDDANKEIYTYPASVFDASGENAALEAVYNAKYWFETQGNRRTAYLLSHVNRFEPGTDGDQFGGNMAQQGYRDINPYLLLDGSMDNEFKFQINGAVLTGIAGDTGEQNKLVVFLHGFHVIGDNGANPEFSKCTI